MSEPRARRWSPARLAVGGVVALWAALFWFLLATGRTGLYLSTRTAWLVPLGAVLTTIAAVGRLATARTAHSTPLRPRDQWYLGLVALPVVLFIALPPATLGTFAANRRAVAGGVAGVVTPGDFEHGPLTMVHVASAQTSDDDLAKLRRRAGEEVTFQGIVVREADTPADELLLTNFIVTCCVADAVTAQVRVVNVPPGSFEEGQWVEVRGRIYPLGREIVVGATAARAIPTPDDPYITAA
jgi:uncharacterized repeat protein (TIGR03943 family)